VDTYKFQKRFLRRLGSYKCQSELVADQKLNKVTSKSQTQKLAEKQSKVNRLDPKTEQNHLKISDAEIGQKETPEFCCCWRKTAVTYKCQKRFLRCLGTYKCQSELVVNQKLNKITSESKAQKSAKSSPK